MKLVAISRIKDEADIIESFVRHHAHSFDVHIVLDDGSSDGTWEMHKGESLPAEILAAQVHRSCWRRPTP